MNAPTYKEQMAWLVWQYDDANHLREPILVQIRQNMLAALMESVKAAEQHKACGG